MIRFKTFILPKIQCGINRMRTSEKIEEKIEVASDQEHAQDEHGVNLHQLVKPHLSIEAEHIKPWYAMDAKKIDKMPHVDLDDVHWKLENHYSKFEGTHVSRIRHYTASSHIESFDAPSFRNINKRILNNEHHPSDHIRMEQMDEALHLHKTPEPMTVWSGISGEHTNTVLYSDKVHHPSYLSTSLSPATAAAFSEDHKVLDTKYPRDYPRDYYSHVLAIHVPEGHPGAYIEHFTAVPGEHEFIMPRDTILKIDHSKREIHTTPLGSYTRHTIIHHAHPVQE
jgi:hypothetical protein